MIGYIKGKLAHKSPTFVYLETGGIGYYVHISLQTFGKIQDLEETILYTSLIVREDSQTLYGFADEEEKIIFNHLLTVSGVGPNTARVILSYLTTDQVRGAILTDRPDAFNSVKGVGPKTAQKIILDLKDKIFKTGDTSVPADFLSTQGNTTADEALSALVALGFVKPKAKAAIEKITVDKTKNFTVEQLIKEALKQMS